MTAIRRPSFSWLIGLVIGLTAFWMVIPTNVIDPANIGWLGIHEDTRTYFLGWDFYRKSAWQWPVSANPNYGMEIAGSIFMADTIPLVAIPLKLFHDLLPATFQYHGLWLVACFALQGVFGWKLASLATSNSWHKVAITALFLFQHPFLSRALGHLPLMGHFFILASLLICLQKREYFTGYWALIIACAACTNAYLLLMVLGLWFSDCLRRATRQSFHWKTMLIEGGAMLALTLFFCWQVGYFSVGGGVSAAGNPYGLYRFNLLSPIDSNGWSVLLKDIPGGAGDGEGFTYLGLGFIFLITAAALSFTQAKANPKIAKLPGNPYLIAVLLMFAIYAITNFIGVGPYSLIIPLPEFLSKFTSVFRGAGRLVWPALYFALVLVTFVVCRNYSARAASVILGLAAALQIADSSAGWAPQKQHVARAQSGTWNIGLGDPFWQEAGKHYRAVRRLPAGNVTPDWSVFGAYAAKHGMQTDSVYLARVNYDQLAQLNLRNQHRIDQGEYDADTLYIASNQKLAAVLTHFKPDRDLIAAVDGYIVIAPQWHAKSSMQVAALTPHNYQAPARQGSHYEMTSFNSVGIRSLQQGWDDEIGSGGVWSNGPVAVLQFPVADSAFKQIELAGTPLTSPKRPSLGVNVSINGEAMRQLAIDGSQPAITLLLTAAERAAITRDNTLTISLSFDQVASPKALGINNDERLISFALKSVRFE